MKNEESGDFKKPNHLSFWKAGRKYFLQTNDPGTVRKVRRWSFSRTIGRGYNCYLYIFAVPVQSQLKARKKLGIPLSGNVLEFQVRPDAGR